MKRRVFCHSAAFLATLAVLAVSPFLASRIGSGLSRLAGDDDGAHVYALTWSFGDERDLDDVHFAVHPASFGLALVLGGIMTVSIAGDVLRRKWRALSWALPPLVAIPLGLGVAVLVRRAGLPIGESVVIGSTFALVAVALVGAYWWTLYAVSSPRLRFGEDRKREAS